MPLKIPAEVTGLERSIERAAKKAGRNLKINLGSSARSVEALSQPLGRITGKADEFTKSMEAANARVLAFGASVGVLSAVTKSFKDLVVTTIQVEKQMISINAILGASNSELSKFQKEIFNVARNTEQSFDTVATAALELSRQGLKAGEVLKRLNDSMILARLSGQGSAEAVAGLTSAINGFKKAGITSTQVVNKFSEAAKNAAVSERDLADAFKRAGAVAGQAGVTFDELVGIVSAVQEKTSRGGAVIGNSFKTIFTRLQSIEKLQTMQNLGAQVTDASGDILSATELMKNLANTIKTLPEARQLQIAEGLVGKFQVAPFISILEDYNDEASKAIKITEISQNASTAAYERNAALNKALSAAINEATVNLKELATTLGEIGVTESLANVLGFFNKLVEGIQNIVDSEGMGGDIARGLLKGIGNVIAGPGLAIFGAVIAKLTIDLVRFGTGSLKTFFGLNRAAKEQAAIQGQIASTLLNNSSVQKTILGIENSTLSVEQKRAAQVKFFTTALNEQLGVMQRMQMIAGRVAPGVMAGTRPSGRGAFGRGAAGHIPNFNAVVGYGSEQADINRGVGGAPPSARPVAIPNFNFGGGQRGTMIANSSEYMVPNFGGGSAIFNQNMVSSMGLPSGARKVGAAGGYIPNFARVKSIEGHLHSLKNQRSTAVDEAASYTGSDINKLNKAAAAKQIQQKRTGNVFDADKRGIALLTMRGGGVPKPFTHKFKDPFMGFNSFKGTEFSIGTDKKKMGKYGKFTNLEAQLDSELAKAANKVVQAVHPDIKTTPPPPITSANIENLIRDEGGPGALEALKGALFESITNAVIGGVKGDGRGTLDIRFTGKNRPAFQSIFGRGLTNKYGVGDYKASIAAKGTFVRQAIKHGGLKGKAAGGYIPNYEGALENAIAREAAAGVPINQIRVNQKSSLRNAANPRGLAVTNTRDEPTGAIPNFINVGNLSQSQLHPSSPMGGAGKALDDVAKSGEKVVRANRDYMGIIFGVQAGLMLLEGATSDAEGGIGRFANRLSDSLGTMAGGAFAGSALMSFGKSLEESTGKVSAFGSRLFKLLGGAAIGFGVISGASKGLSNVIRDWSGVTDQGATSISALKDASDAAAMSLVGLSELAKEEHKQFKESVFGGGLLDANKNKQLQLRFPLGSGGTRAASEAALDEFMLRGGSFERFREIVDEAGAVSAKGNLPARKSFPTKESFDTFIEIIKKEIEIMGKGLPEFFKNFDRTSPQFQGAKRAFDRAELSRAGKKSDFNQKDWEEFNKIEAEVVKMGIKNSKVRRSLFRKFFDTKAEEGAAEELEKRIKQLTATGLLKGGAMMLEAKLARALSGDELKVLESGVLGNVAPGALSRAKQGANLAAARDASVVAVGEKFANILKDNDILNLKGSDAVAGQRFIAGLDFNQIAGISQLEQSLTKMAEVLFGEGQNKILAPQIRAVAEELDLVREEKMQKAQILNLNEQITRQLELQAGITSNAEAEAARLQKQIESGALDYKGVRGANPFDRFKGRFTAQGTRELKKLLDKAAKSGDFSLANEQEAAMNLGITLINASETFARNIGDSLVDAIVQGKSLGDALRSAATDFFTMMSKAFMQRAVDQIVGGIGGGGGFLGLGGLFQKNASGGMISGGSGVRDDVPALLTGGEFVMRKSAVQKYGAGFMGSLNSGSVPRFANGGMFIPGTYGQGAIQGKQNLLGFATQSGTSPRYDSLAGGSGFGAIALAPESLRMTNLGRSMSPAFRRTQEAKSDAFDLYVQQLAADAQRREQKKQLEQAKKDRKKALWASLGVAALSGFAFGGGLKKLGGLFKGQKGAGSTPNRYGWLGTGNPIDDTIVNPSMGPTIEPPLPLMNTRIPDDGLFKGAMGGSIPYAAGVDTVPAMLSGGEFVMNAAATSRIGSANLEALNAGGSLGGGGSNVSVSKGDTNINIVVNSDGTSTQRSGGSNNDEDKNLAVKLKDAVKEVISQEKRLGGMLRA